MNWKVVREASIGLNEEGKKCLDVSRRRLSHWEGTCNSLQDPMVPFLSFIGIISVMVTFYDNTWWRCNSNDLFSLSFLFSSPRIRHMISSLLPFRDKKGCIVFFFFCSPFIFNLLKMKNQNLFFIKSRVNSIMRYFSSSKKTQKKISRLISNKSNIKWLN